MSSTTPFEELFPELPRIDRAWEERKQRLMAKTPAERVAAMRAGELSYRELSYWSAARPDEVPRVSTGAGARHCGAIGGGGEFEWIACFEPDVAEYDERAARERDANELYAAALTRSRSQVGRPGARARART